MACGLDGSDDQQIAELGQRVTTLESRIQAQETRVAEAMADPGTAPDATPPPTSRPIPPTPAGGDFTPPEFVEVSISPSVADVTAGDVDITITVQMADDLSGVGEVQLDFMSPSTQQRKSFFQIAPSSSTNWTYTHILTLPRFSESGTWRLDIAHLRDRVGNHRMHRYDELVALGLTASFEVVYDP